MMLGVTPFFVEHSYVETYGPKCSLLRRASVPVGHLRIYNLTPLKALLRRNGFEVKKSAVSLSCRYRPCSRRINSYLDVARPSHRGLS